MNIWGRHIKHAAKYIRFHQIYMAARTKVTGPEATVYVHWPYCEKRCTYCNFNKYIDNSVDEDRMMRCLVKETSTLLDKSQVTSIKSIFFGGGTPSLANPKTLGAIIECVQKKVNLATNAEITLEVNPTMTELAKLRDFQGVGVNRVSLGVQSLKEKDLKVLGRTHSVSDSLRTLEMAKTLFRGKTSVDVIFGLPEQTVESWDRELKQLLPLLDDHVSLYQLTLERGTSLFKQVINRELTLPTQDVVAEMYDTAISALEQHGFRRYEASNFARNDAESVHNSAYWEGTQYIGVGPGAHGRFVPLADGKTSREARIQTLEPEPWMREVEKYGHATRKATPLTQLNVLEELLMLGLRTEKGVTEKVWAAHSDTLTIADIFGDTYMIRMLQDEGFLILDKTGLRTTPKGLNVVDAVARELIPILQQQYEAEQGFGNV